MSDRKKLQGKPTNEFQISTFPKSGGYSTSRETIPKEKELKEDWNIGMFLEALEDVHRFIKVEKRLDNKSTDNDFLCVDVHNGEKIVVELTELVDTVVENKIDNPLQKDIPIVVVKGGNEKSKYLQILIQQKVEHYAMRKEKFWLVVCSTSTYAVPRAIKNGKVFTTDSGCLAQEYLEGQAKEETNPFDAVWFFHPSLSPMRIWPKEPEGNLIHLGNVCWETQAAIPIGAKAFRETISSGVKTLVLHEVKACPKPQKLVEPGYEYQLSLAEEID